MKITSVEAIPLRIPFTHGGPSIAWAGRDWQFLEIVLIRVGTDSDLVGWGEAFSYNCQKAVVAMIEESAPAVLLGKSVADRDKVKQELHDGIQLWGR